MKCCLFVVIQAEQPILWKMSYPMLEVSNGQLRGSNLRAKSRAERLRTHRDGS